MKPCSSFIEDITPNDTLARKTYWRRTSTNDVPVNVLYVPGRDKPIILPKTLTISNVHAALAELGK